jgi:hypothetical protein
MNIIMTSGLSNKIVIESPYVIIADPCYTISIGGRIKVLITPGNYNCEVEEYDDRVKSLSIILDNLNILDLHWDKTDYVVGVDSGQVGIFDIKYYKDDNYAKTIKCINPNKIIYANNEFFSKCCDRALSDDSWGTFPFGVVSSSGYGDGGYEIFVLKTKEYDLPVGYKVIFIEDNEKP